MGIVAIKQEKDMSKEIERKFVVTRNLEEVLGKEKLETLDCSEIEQFYVEISEEREVRFRKRVTGKEKMFYKTIKSSGGLVREEIETEIVEEEYERNLEKRVGNKILKRRYVMGRLEIDVYSGKNDFFVVEIEFGDEEEANLFTLPEKFCPVTEATSDKRWKNKNIALKGVPSV
jgi:CYTH domain-containing protein